MNMIPMPPNWCSEICINSMTDVCLEKCAIKRDASRLKIRRDLTIAKMPQLPNTDTLSRDERFKIVMLYLAKITEHIQANPLVTE